MKTSLFTIICLVGWVGVSSVALGNPSMLPSHPGYPMDNAKDPVTGMPLANDPGQVPLTSQESLSKASMFHDAASVETRSDQLPNVVHTESASTTQSSEKGLNR